MTQRDEDIARAIRLKDANNILALFFEKNAPSIKQGFKTETELWDYKSDVPFIGRQHANAWANLAKDIIGFHNQRGGVMFFGFTDDFLFKGATQRLDSKLINEQLRRYIPDTVYVEFHREFIQENQHYLGLALIPPRAGPLVRFTGDAPIENGAQLFKKGWSSIRRKDSTYIMSPSDVEETNRKDVRLHVGQKYYIDEPCYRVPAPDYVSFIYRDIPCREIETALQDPRTAVAHVIGIGGLGKTALATWAAIRAYEQKRFSFIASCTAKDRELTTMGIAGLKPEFTSFESLLNAVCEILQFTEFKALPILEKEGKVRELLKDSGGLLFVDNLETVDDPRIIRFLDTLPVGVRALVTSRRLTVKFSVYPVTLGPMNDKETCAFVRSLQSLNSCAYASTMKDAQIAKIGSACDHIPLAIRWVLSKSKSPVQALREADAIGAGGKQGEELLEFSFRRVFENMSPSERVLLEVLSLFTQAQPSEVLLVGSGLKLPDLQDALSALIEDAIIVKGFDPERNDDSYSILPITRAFVYSDVVSRDGREQAIRARLRDYFEARDIKNPDDQIVVRAVRQNAEASDAALLDLAISARRKGDLESAQELLRQAIARNARSWRAYRELAELYRHEFKRIGDALRCYEQAAANAPSDRFEKAKLFREWGILIRDSGLADAQQQSVIKLEAALELNGRDIVTITALAQQYDRKGAWFKVIDLCAPWKDEVYGRAKETMLPLLQRAYEQTGDDLKSLELKERLRR